MAKTTSTPSASILDARRRHDQVDLEQALVAAAAAGAELARLRPATRPAELERIADRAHRAAGRLRDAAARALET